MVTKHLANRELDSLTRETDFFGHIDKGNAIVAFLNSNIENLNRSSMIALYGKWGSGKSTLMKYIGDELEKGRYKSLHFPTWEFEKDDNLPLSLVQFIADEIGVTTTTAVKEFISASAIALKAGVKSITLNLPGVSVSGANFSKTYEDFFDSEAKLQESLYNKTKELKKKFSGAEKAIIKKTKKDKLIIFIDDLDRCEPDNILNLISAIKLFFTYDSKIVFVFGFDKEAINKAIQHKYGDIIKAEEYLEKVIDISFSMPQEISIKKLVEVYFSGEIKLINGHTVNVSEDLEDFFKSIGFYNPRHLKKVFNKFEILKTFQGLTKESSVQTEIIPNLIPNNLEDLMLVKFTLFFIVLHEFYNETFNELMHFSQKKVNYTSIYRDTMISSNGQKVVSFEEANSILHTSAKILNSLNHSFKEINLLIKSNQNRHKEEILFNYFLTIFTPILHAKILITSEMGRQFISQFYHKNNTNGDVISLKFCEYLLGKRDIVLNINSDYIMINYFKMCQMFL